MKKNYTWKFFSFIAGVVDTADKHSFVIISANFRKKLNDPNGILRGQGDTDLRKNLKSKISCQTPFKQIIPFDIARDRCEDW